MKIKKHLQIDAITNSTGRLPSDMENLTVYHHSSSKDEPINVGDMDLTYLIRAYAKCQRQLAQEVRIDTQEGRNLELTSKVENLNSIIAEKDELLDKQTAHTEYWRDAYYKSSTVKGEVKMFSEIPNDASGKAFVAQLKEYLNKESYKMRVRGQYLDEETKKAEGWQKYERGQPIDKSKCLRIYVDTK